MGNRMGKKRQPRILVCQFIKMFFYFYFYIYITSKYWHVAHHLMLSHLVFSTYETNV